MYVVADGDDTRQHGPEITRDGDFLDRMGDFPVLHPETGRTTRIIAGHEVDALAEQIRVGGEDPGEYVEVSFKVAERAYAAWPERIRNAFEPARTVRTGKPTYRLTICTERELRDGGVAIPFTGGIG